MLSSTSPGCQSHNDPRHLTGALHHRYHHRTPHRTVSSEYGILRSMRPPLLNVRQQSLHRSQPVCGNMQFMYLGKLERQEHMVFSDGVLGATQSPKSARIRLFGEPNMVVEDDRKERRGWQAFYISNRRTMPHQYYATAFRNFRPQHRKAPCYFAGIWRRYHSFRRPSS